MSSIHLLMSCILLLGGQCICLAEDTMKYACGARAIYFLEQYYRVDRSESFISVVDRLGSELTDKGISMATLCHELTKLGIENIAVEIDDVRKVKLTEPFVVHFGAESNGHFAVCIINSSNVEESSLMWDGLRFEKFNWNKIPTPFKAIITGSDVKEVQVRHSRTWLVCVFVGVVAVAWRQFVRRTELQENRGT
jgi:hypothetical protein